MRKFIIMGMAALLALSACTDKKKEAEAKAQADATREELIQAVNDRDELLNLMSEITSDMEQIKSLENILTVSGEQENPDRRAQIRANMAAIQKTLEERREALADLEKKLSVSVNANAGLKKTIASLRSQIDSQTAEINSLKASLGEATEKIGTLDNAVDSLNTTVTRVTADRDSVAQVSVDLANELNLCYYAIGTNKELKENKILESGFLRKTKIMQGDFDQSFFTAADKRTLTNIDLNAK
ncbi:MAG: hypothetical protein K2J38_00800, partial [Muribaculaceae bacterium]|nr:hypothetical protein [Muribaculaceae bacterium]